MNRKERILKYINSSDDFVVNGKRYCENDFYNDVEDLVKENKKYKEVIDKVIEYEEEIMYLANKVAITTQNVEIKAIRDRLEEIFEILKGEE